MASPLDEMTRLLAGLALGNSCMPTLESLRILLASVSINELRDYVPKIDVDRLYKCLSTSDQEQIQLTCEILKRILNTLRTTQVLDRYEDLLLEGLGHPDTGVKELIIQELQTAANDSTASEQLSTKLELLLSCLRLVGSTDTGIASKASKVLISLAQHDDAGNVLMSAPLVEEMRTIAMKNDTTRYRIYDIVVSFSCVSREKLSIASGTRLIQQLLKEVSSDDILVRLNALELLRTLAACQHGRDFLEQQGTIQTLADGLSQACADPLGSLIVPGFMKFFGTLAHFQPAVISRYPSFTQTMFNLLEDPDVSLKIVATETISFIATEVEGKLALGEQGDRMDTALNSIGTLLAHANNEVRLKALHSVAELIDVPISQLENGALLSTVERWFHLLHAKPIQLIMTVMKQPFKDVRSAALNILLYLSAQPWAQKLMSQQPGFLEFLLDRQAEPDKICLELKFNIVKTIAETLEANPAGIWGEHAMSQMHQHVREGPWFIRAQSSVAFESGP